MGDSTERPSAVSWCEHIRQLARTRLEAHVANENNADYLDDFELDDTALKQVAGGAIYERCNDHCYTLDGCGALT